MFMIQSMDHLEDLLKDINILLTFALGDDGEVWVRPVSAKSDCELVPKCCFVARPQESRAAIYRRADFGNHWDLREYYGGYVDVLVPLTAFYLYITEEVGWRPFMSLPSVDYCREVRE